MVLRVGSLIVEIAKQLEARIEIFFDLFNRLANLHDGIEFKVSGGDNHNDFVGHGKSIEREPRERGRTIYKNEVVTFFDLVQFPLYARFPMIFGCSQFNIGVGKQNVKGV